MSAPLKAPFPWFGGKSRAAGAVWAALGDCEHYVEPFAGSLAVLLGRPHEPNRPYHSESVNDADGLLCNAWRAIQLHPDAVAAACSWPVSEADIHARHLALVRWREAHELEHLMGDPAWCDPVMAGWWLYGIAGWIGAGWCAGDQPWTADADGRLYRQPPARGRESGVSRQLPDLGNDGRGVQRMTLREPGLAAALPDHVAEVVAPSLPADAYHPLVMPQLAAWFAALSARLRHVRIVHGDWQRVCTSGALRTLSVRKGGKGGGACGVFLDPPYTTASGRAADLYAVDSGTVADDVRAWCLAHGAEPDLRIVLAGWAGEHEADLLAAGWRVVSWYRRGWLTGGYASQGAGSRNDRERLLLSPHCLVPAEVAL